MASEQRTVDFILEQIGHAGRASAKKMFGEYGLYFDGKMVAMVCDDMLYVKPTKAGRAQFDQVVEASPYPGAKPCFLVAGDLWEDHQWLSHLITVSAMELPEPKKKKA
jgi:TfoX/Sxy family transcriptional regulator of competence genes